MMFTTIVVSGMYARLIIFRVPEWPLAAKFVSTLIEARHVQSVMYERETTMQRRHFDVVWI